MRIDRDRVISAAHDAGRAAAAARAEGERVQAPDMLAGSLLARQAASAWHRGFAQGGGVAEDAGPKAPAGTGPAGRGTSTS